MLFDQELTNKQVQDMFYKAQGFACTSVIPIILFFIVPFIFYLSNNSLEIYFNQISSSLFTLICVGSSLFLITLFSLKQGMQSLKKGGMNTLKAQVCVFSLLATIVSASLWSLPPTTTFFSYFSGIESKTIIIASVFSYAFFTLVFLLTLFKPVKN